MTTEIHVREAKPTDKDAVLKFCQYTFEWGDYIQDVWDYWLKAPKGKIFVATHRETPIAISHVAIIKPGEAWLEGARTAPEYRRKGITSLLNNTSLKFARKNGAKVARLITDSNNFAAQKVLAKLGFKRISEWANMELEDCTFETASENVRWAEKSDVDEIWDFLEASECYAESAGLFTILFRWMSLDRGRLRRFVERNMAIVYEEDARFQGLFLLDNAVKYAWHENSIQTCYVDGELKAVLGMGRFLKRHCYSNGIAKIYGVMCNCPPLVSGFSELGFKNHNHTELVYEKKIA